MLTFAQLLINIGAFQAFLLAFLLFFTPNTSSASKILATFCLFLGISFVVQNLYQQNNYITYPQLIGLSEFIPASYGALLYLYLYSALTGKSISRGQWLHFSPIVICYLLGLPEIIASPQYKIQLVEAINNNQTIPLNLFIALKIVVAQAFVYGGLSLWFLLKYYRRAERNLSTFNGAMIIWLAVFTSLYSITWVFKTFSFYNWIGDAFILMLVSAIAIFQWRKPDLFKTPIPNDAVDLGKAAEIGSTAGKQSIQIGVDADIKYGEARLPDDLLKLMANEANDLMNKQKPYLDSKLTLNELASELGYSNHQLSQVINLNEGKNFYQWVNQYRVDAVMAKLSESPTIKVLDVALDCGFSSKSSFNFVFKKLTQMTPSEYKQTIRQT